mmetsp:Transcript_19021/g.39904  ORF Transcript_19021/g.39904 Transcript_19021/m.39904 type:complete len:83 (+) Transcript_19021:317-565(+)
MKKWGLGEGVLRKQADMEDLHTAWTNKNYKEVNAVIESKDYHPLLMGQLVALEIDLLSKDNTDGWNCDGIFTYDWEMGEAVP